MVWWVPSFLQMAKCRCSKIVDTKYGNILGVSNSFWGIWYYLALILMFTANFFFYMPFHWIMITSFVAVLFSLYLIRGLFLLGVICRTCMGVHGINFLILVVSVIQWFVMGA